MCPEGGAFITFVMVEIFTILVFLRVTKLEREAKASKNLAGIPGRNYHVEISVNSPALLATCEGDISSILGISLRYKKWVTFW